MYVKISGEPGASGQSYRQSTLTGREDFPSGLGDLQLRQSHGIERESEGCISPVGEEILWSMN
jgi:hypothetical protein